MTRAERQEKIEETRNAKYHKQGGRCANCGRAVPFSRFQLAHVIPQRKWCISHFGAKVIHHPLNMRGVCGLECNAAVQIQPDSAEAGWFAETIREAIDGDPDEVW